MKNLTLLLLGQVLITIPACLSQNNDKQCFSQALNPSYPCCKGTKVVFTDKDGDWGVENNKWCGIGNSPSNASDDCFSVALGYKCCESCDVIFTDKDGNWGVENKKWCGIKDSCFSDIETENPVQNITDFSKTDFEFSFLKMENDKKNMLFSPLSILYGLNMLQEGADGNTYAQINKIIGNMKLPKYSSIEEKLSLANGLYIRDYYFNLIKPSFINTLKEKYDAEVKEDEFKDATNVNNWIEDKTLGIIKDLIEDDMVQNPYLVMLIINALAIDMEWIIPFSTSSTWGQPFYKDDGEKIIATTMSNKIFDDIVSYYIDDNITVFTMDLKDYDGVQFEFMAIMPKENLSAYVESVSKAQINDIDKKLKLASTAADGVVITIPKFKFDYELNFKKDLIDLGIKDAFNEALANFSKMADQRELPLYVSAAIHKADIEFTEKGVKAAAVTVFAMMTGSAMPRETHPVYVTIDKPFMFIIRDKNTKENWFTGTVYEPNLWENDRSDYSF